MNTSTHLFLSCHQEGVLGEETLETELAFGHKPTVLLADDHSAMLKNVTDVLTPHFDVVAAVSDGKAALDAAALKNPDVALLDVVMPIMNGIRAARELRQSSARTQIVFLTGVEDDDLISEALSIGARGYVLKRRLYSDLVPAMNLALGGHFFISPHSFVGQVNPELVVPRPVPASMGPGHGSPAHIMEFYSDERAFARGASDFVRASLAQDRVAIVLLKREYLTFLSQRLSKSGLDMERAIQWGNYRQFAVESTAPLLMPNGRLDRTRFVSFFEPLMARAAQRTRSSVVVLANLGSALMDLGYDHENALQAEELWSELVQHSLFHVHCVCPVTSLGTKRNRETLAQICSHHFSVIPIDQAKRVFVQPDA